MAGGGGGGRDPGTYFVKGSIVNHKSGLLTVLPHNENRAAKKALTWNRCRVAAAAFTEAQTHTVTIPSSSTYRSGVSVQPLAIQS